MEEILEKLQHYKQQEESNITSNEEQIEDILYYGQINLSKNDADLKNETSQELYLVKKIINGKQQAIFQTDTGIIATVSEENEIQISQQYKELINEKELLLQMHKVEPLSLNKLEELRRQKQEKTSKKSKNKNENERDKTTYKNNPKDIQIDMNKKITETKTFADLVPEIKQKGIVDIHVRRTDTKEFEFIGINKAGEELPITSLVQTEGTNPSQEVVHVNGDGSSVKNEQVYTMLKLKNGQNVGKGDEGFTVKLGAYGIPEVSYYRRANELDEYTSIPVNLKTTNQKQTDKDVRQYMEKKRNTTVDDNIKRANARINNEQEETELENIDDDPYNDKIVDNSEIIIRKAAKRCKISVQEFKKQLEKTEGQTLEEKIEEAEEEINEQYRGQKRERA